MKNIKLLLTIGIIFPAIAALGQNLPPIEITEDWIERIKELVPTKTTIKLDVKRKILVFSKATGFNHWVIPHNNIVLKAFGKKTDAFEIHIGYDVENFDLSNLNKYDAVVLNNSNPEGPKRNLFYDLLKNNTTLNENEIISSARIYEENLLNYVKKGGGLMILHGAIVVQNNSSKFSEMTGASFDYHPPQQEIHVKEVDINHPLVKAFNGKGFTHYDEPYFFKNSYFKYNFKPLLYFEADKIVGLKHEVDNNINYISWIKKYGKGRIFYSSASHNAQSFENKQLLQFLMDGLQYVTGDYHVNDTPLTTP